MWCAVSFCYNGQKLTEVWLLDWSAMLLGTAYKSQLYSAELFMYMLEPTQPS